jgi:hypothetical protein
MNASNTATVVTEQPSNIDALTERGDYCFIGDKLLMACPICGGIFYCPHEVVQRSPLTLSPSVVGPPEAWNSIPPRINAMREQVMAPCGHHFWVKEGVVFDAM